KSALAKEPIEEPIAEVVMDEASDVVSRDDYQPQDTSEPKTRKTMNPDCTELEYNFYECFNALTDKLDWNNLEGDRYSFDLSKPLLLQGPPVHQKVASNYFFNNDLEYLKNSDPEVTYTTSITKIKATRLFHLDWNDIVDFIVALRMFTRSLILKRRVEDLQLGKFSDGTLKSVRDEIHYGVLDFHLDYNKEMPKRKWMAVNRMRLSLMTDLIDKQLRERETIINLERVVGAMELEIDYKLMTHTI
nr:hypothetical protein [Tanacetum cinerariifolium]